MEERASESDEVAEKALALEQAVIAAVAACDGDLRATIRALLVSNSYLHDEVERLRALISPGFARGRVEFVGFALEALQHWTD